MFGDDTIWLVGERDGTQRILSRAFETGICFFDTADVYSKWVDGNMGGVAEEYIGRWPKHAKIECSLIVS